MDRKKKQGIIKTLEIMKTTAIHICIFLAVLFTPKIQYATIITSNGTEGGEWGSASTWNPNIPVCGDTIIILAGDVVTIESTQDYSSCPTYMILYINGTLEFPVNGPRLKFPANSTIFVNVGGLLTATFGPGAGNADFISIGDKVVWKKEDGDIHGYHVFGGTTLPIQLINFEANVNEHVIDLKWMTATEINNDYFTVEKSNNVKKWEEVLSTSGAGNSNTTLEYAATDYNPITGVSYYRLKQTDYDGAYTYFDIVAVNYQTNSDENFNVFPNPIKIGESVNIKNLVGNDLIVVLQDVNGKKYFTKLVSNDEEGKTIKIPINANVPSGTYLISATCGNQMCSKKIVIK